MGQSCDGSAVDWLELTRSNLLWKKILKEIFTDKPQGIAGQVAQFSV